MSRAAGPKPLNNGGWDVNGEPLKDPNENGLNSGLYLFTDRNNITLIPKREVPELLSMHRDCH